MRKWRTPVAVAVAGALAGVLLSTAGAADQGDGGTDDDTDGGTVVRTENGAVRGAVSGSTRTFRSIPYAAPPVGDLRWHSPRRPDRWTGTRDATTPSPVCAQFPGEVPSGSVDEDCLYLDVTTPAAPSKRPKPVVVWVHGGGFYMGAARNYPAERLVTGGDVVVVSVNYRLGVFGFFGHPGLAGSGTYGLADQQAAFGWVKRNIARFGGDPRNVTVAGQSAGAISTCAHLTSPDARGMFDKVVMQSGSCGTEWYANADFRGQPADAIYEPLDRVEEQGRQTAAGLGCARTDDDEALACLRALPVDKLMPVLQKFVQPAYGTRLLPENPADAVREGRFHRMPVLSGQTRDEQRLPTSMYDNFQYPMSEETYQAVMTDTFGDQRAEVEAEYPRADHDSAALAWSAITTDSKWTCNQYETSKRLAERAPVYHYEFADENAPPLSPAPPAMPMGAYHSAELWSLFDLGGIDPNLDEGQQRLSDRMIGYWSTFARTGDPNDGNGPEWPEFGAGAHVLSLAPGENGIAPIDLARAHHCGFWSSR